MQRGIKGQLYEGKSSKQLIKSLPDQSIALLWHEDIDSLTSQALKQKKVKAVINRNLSMSGRFEHHEIRRLIRSGISVFDVETWYGTDEELVNVTVVVVEEQLFLEKDQEFVLLADLQKYTHQRIEDRLIEAKEGYQQLWSDFVTNTLGQANDEMDKLNKPTLLPHCLQQVKDRNVLIVARNGSYKQDLLALRRWLLLMNPLIIAVDGAADGLLELGFKPDLIIGDMDSVSLSSLRSGADIVCHSYLNGIAPGMKRLEENEIEAEQLACIGTSEDAAILSAFWAEAEHLFLIGCRTGVKEFLEKNRDGMASTVLTRMQVGDKLTDLKGVYPLFASTSVSSQFQKVSHDLQEEWSELKTLIGRGYRMLLKKEAFRHD